MYFWVIISVSLCDLCVSVVFCIISFAAELLLKISDCCFKFAIRPIIIKPQEIFLKKQVFTEYYYNAIR